MIKKILLILTILLSTNITFANENLKFKIFNAKIVAVTGEEKEFEISFLEKIKVLKFGDPEIKNHGFYEYFVQTYTQEDYTKICEITSSIGTRDDSYILSQSDILKKFKDSKIILNLCNGLKIEIPSLNDIFNENLIEGKVYAPALNLPIGKVLLSFKMINYGTAFFRDNID
jgi:hypothetical protein